MSTYFCMNQWRLGIFFCYHYHEGIRLFSQRTKFEKKKKKERSVWSLKIDSSVWTEQRAEKLKFRYIHTRQLYLSITVDCIFIVSDSLHILLFHTYFFGRIFASEELIAIFPFGWMKSKPNWVSTYMYYVVQKE